MLNPQQVCTNHVDTVDQHYDTKIILQLSYRLDGENGVNMNLYGIYKRNTIENTCLMNAYLDDTREYCHDHNLMYVTCADVPGYMNEGCSTLHAYNGKYGKGVVRTRPCFYKGRRSTNYMTIEYWVTRDDIHKRLTGESEVTR